jgi:hypothetical protein
VNMRASVRVFGLGPAHRNVVRHKQTVRDAFMPSRLQKTTVRKG